MNVFLFEIIIEDIKYLKITEQQLINLDSLFINSLMPSLD